MVAAQGASANLEIYEGLVFGVGKGTFIIICFMFFGVLLCFFRHSYYYPNVIIAVAIIIPCLVFLFFYVWPKDSLETDKTKYDELPKSWYFIKSILFLALISILFMISLCSLCYLKCKRVRVKRIDSEIGANAGEQFYDDRTGYSEVSNDVPNEDKKNEERKAEEAKDEDKNISDEEAGELEPAVRRRIN